MTDDHPTPSESARGREDVRRGVAREQVRAQLFGGVAAATTIDRFTLLECIGSGGMGTVYAAYDPTLDRRIALKLLRDDLEQGSGDERQGQARLVREARAMAKLSHPNVGVVHEVGAVEGTDGRSTVWIAMEFIAGEGLGTWRGRAQPEPAAILDAYMQMGRGLAAAHAAGIVHRDVKPDNAMRDEHGHVRVLDFGLARPVDANASATSNGNTQVGLEDVDVDSFTRTGAVVGTPAYMAPEQFDGGTADARTDQYGYCVALFEALWGVRPHAGTTILALAQARRRGAIVDVPRRRGVPVGVRGIVLRGLAPAPADRWPSMDALLRALERTRIRRRGRVALAATVVVAASAVAGVIALARPANPPCVGVGDDVTGAWAAGRDRIAAAFALDDRPFVPATTGRVIGVLDRYAQELTEAYREACRATHEQGLQSTDVLDRQVACLDARRSRLAAQVALFERADGALIERATQTAEMLEPIDPCRQRGALLAVTPPEPAVAAAVAAIEEELAQTAAARNAGHYEDAQRAGRAALDHALQTGYRPIVARAQLELSEVADAQGDDAQALLHANEAYFMALQTDQYDEAVRGASVAASTVAPQSANFALAQHWHRAGLAAAERLDDGEVPSARVDLAYAHYLLAIRDDPRARELLRRAHDVLQRRMGADAFEVWDIELSLARGLIREGAAEQARPMIAQAHERAARQLADDPVRLTNALGRIAQLYSFIGDLETAEPLAAQAVALAEVNLGEQHPNTNVMRVDLALLHYRAGRPQQAADVLAKAIEATRLRTQDDVHARALHMHAITMKQLKRLDEALDSETRSFAWYREHLPSDTQTLVGSYLTLGNIQLLRDDNSAAEQAYLAALELSKQHGLRDRLLMARSDYANFLFQTGRAGQAVTELETLLAELAQDGGSAYDVAQYEFDLARALWRVGNRGRARAVATRVLQVLRTVEPTPQVNGHIRRDWTVEEVEQWFPDPDAWEDT